MIEKRKNSIVNSRDNLFHKYSSYTCPFCSSLPEILNYNDVNNTIKFKCKKHGEIILDLQEYLEKLTKWEGTSETKTKNKCNLHNEQYIYYCKNCEENICKKCLKELSNHENHSKYEIKSICPNNTELSLIKERINICFQEKEELMRKIKNLDNKIVFYDTLIYSYERQPPNFLLNINIKHLLYGEKLNFDSIKNSEFIKIQTKKEMFEDFVKNNFINATKGLNQLYLKNKKMGNDLLDQIIKGIEDDTTIYKILFFGKQIQNSKEIILLRNIKLLNLHGNNISSLDFLSGKKFFSLEILSLNNNVINSIDILKTISFPLLSELYLSKNKISNIDVLSKLNVKKLRVLWLSDNYITSIDILAKVQFPELSKLGLNKNIINNISVFKKNIVKFPQIYELYLNDNEFKKEKFYEILKELYHKIPEFYY